VTPDPHARFDELAAGHALHALEPADEQAFLSHLERCPECKLAIEQHTETLGHLAYAAPQVDLPAGILEGIRREIGVPLPAAVAPPLSLDAARRRRRPSLQAQSWIGVAAAVALVLSLGVWNVALHQDRSDADRRADRLAAAVSTLTRAGTTRVDLTDAKGSAVAVAVVRDSSVSLVVDGLSPNDRHSSTYVLWQQVSTGMRAVGAFDVTGDVDVVSGLHLPVSTAGTGFAVTREPGRTAPAAPSSAPLAAGGLSF
jgi:hypothetical protein